MNNIDRKPPLPAQPAHIQIPRLAFPDMPIIRRYEVLATEAVATLNFVTSKVL